MIPQHDRPSTDALARMRYEASAKSLFVGYLLWFLLGYGGAHRMYLGRWVSGLLMLGLFGLSWLLMPVLLGYPIFGVILLWWLLDALLLPGMTRRSNLQLIERLSG